MVFDVAGALGWCGHNTRLAGGFAFYRFDDFWLFRSDVGLWQVLLCCCLGLFAAFLGFELDVGIWILFGGLPMRLVGVIWRLWVTSVGLGVVFFVESDFLW